MKTDSLLYSIFQTQPEFFFDLINEAPQATYTFRSVEVKQTAFRIDGLLAPDSDKAPLYFLEVQFQSDLRFYSRFFAEIFAYLHLNQPKNDWRAVVLFPTRRTDTGRTAPYQELLGSHRIQRLYLDELTNDTLGVKLLQLVIEPESATVVSAKELVARSRRELKRRSLQKSVLKWIDTLMLYKFPKLTRKEIEAMFELPDLKKTRVYQEMTEEYLKVDNLKKTRVYREMRDELLKSENLKKTPVYREMRDELLKSENLKKTPVYREMQEEFQVATVVRMHKEGFTEKQIAAALAVSVNAVKKIIASPPLTVKAASSVKAHRAPSKRAKRK